MVTISQFIKVTINENKSKGIGYKYMRHYKKYKGVRDEFIEKHIQEKEMADLKTGTAGKMRGNSDAPNG